MKYLLPLMLGFVLMYGVQTFRIALCKSEGRSQAYCEGRLQ